MARIVNYAFLIIGIVCIAYYLTCGISVRFNQSLLWIWLVAGIYLICRFAIVQLSIVRGQPLPFPRGVVITYRVFVALVMMLFVVTEFFVVKGSFTQCPQGVDYLIVLGAKTGSVTIERRIERAAQYLADNPETVCIVSGGQGADEDMAEATYMKNGLVDRGIEAQRIITETMSKDTVENIRFSHVYADEAGASVALVSSDYHMFRSMAIARKVFDGDIYGLPSRSSMLYYPHYAVREFCGIVVETLRGNLRF